jgi:hypothetical protein
VTGTSTLSGNVGIGTTTPAHNLTVGGDLAAGTTLSVGNSDSEFTPNLQGWIYAVNSINRINTGGDGHAALETTVQSSGGAEGIWAVSYVTGNSQEADGATVDGNITGSNATAVGAQGRAFGETGSGQTLYGVQGSVGEGFPDSGGTAQTAAALVALSTYVSNGGVITNGYGLFVQDQTAGVNNFAIKTGLGKVSFGDKVGISTTSPVANFQVANGSNATTTMEVGSTGQNKGSCLKLYRTDGSAIYAYIAAGATTFTLTSTACASVSNF